MDGQEENTIFAQQFAFTFPLLCDTTKEMTKAFECCLPSKDGTDPCAMAARVCVVVDETGKIVKYISPFNAREGPAALLYDLRDEL